MDPINKKQICEHPDCDLRFKTKKQKIMHHNKLENECKLSKVAMLRLIAKYKEIFLKLKRKHNAGDMDDNERFLKLKKTYDDVLSQSVDKEYLITFIGENFNT